MKKFSQNYGNTRNVLNAENIYILDDLGIRNADASRLPPDVTILATQINRDPQYEAILQFLEARSANNTCRRPALVVLHGCDAEMHRAFVLRCERVELQEFLGDREVCHGFGRVKWPREVIEVEAVLRWLNECFGLSRLAPRRELETRLSDLPHSFCFSHHVKAKYWDAEAPQLVDNWVNYIREDWPEMRPGRFVLCFLCVEYPAIPTASSQAAQAYVEKLQTKYEGDPCVLITRELRPVSKSDVLDWSGQTGRILGERWDETVIINGMEQLFPLDESRPLAHVFDHLLGLLHKAYWPHPVGTQVFSE